MNLQEIQAFFEAHTQEKCLNFFALPQSGSSRLNCIAETPNEKVVITLNENLKENEAFFYFSEVFKALQLPSPEIKYIHPNRNLYIQEYLGSNTLSEVISQEGASERVKILVQKALKRLFEVQQKTAGKIDYQNTFEFEVYDELPIMHDLYYFKNFMADVLELSYQKGTLLKEFKEISRRIESLEPKVLMIRDFQSRNIMVDKDEVYFIDYQSAMLGPAMYDVVSFLFQAKANFSKDFKQEMLDFFYQLYPAEQRTKLEASLPYLQLIRYLQVLGAYGFRGLIQRKAHFIESIEQGIKNLHEFWKEQPVFQKDFPELSALITAISSEKTAEKVQRILAK